MPRRRSEQAATPEVDGLAIGMRFLGPLLVGLFKLTEEEILEEISVGDSLYVGGPTRLIQKTVRFGKGWRSV
jgi:hypothetical protein